MPDRRRVLLLGWDGADPRLLQPLLDAGHVPALARLIAEGMVGTLSAPPPVASAPLWATIASGVLADRHGVCTGVEAGPYGTGLQPVTAAAWRAAPLWKIVADQGRRSAAVGWPATEPAAAAGGSLVVSDRFPLATGADFDAWPMPPDAVHPPALRARMRDLRVHPAEIDGDQLGFFVPAVAEAAGDPRLRALAVLLAAAGTVHAAGTWLAEHEEWDLLAVRYDLLGGLGRAFMPYRAPHMVGTSAEDAARYGEVIDRGYRFLDLLLSRYLRLVGPDTTVIVVSNHGYRWGDDRPRTHTRPLDEVPEAWYRPHGLLAARGPGLRRDELVFGASALDIAPTVLAMLGLPVGRDMEGRVLAQLFEERPAVTWVERHAPPVPEAGATGSAESATHDALELLRSLGYPDAPVAAPAPVADQIRVLELGALAQIGFGRRQWATTAALLTELLALRPQHRFATYLLARCRLRLGDVEGCRELIRELLAHDIDSPLAHLAFGLVEAYEGRWEEALARYHRALEAAPHNAELHYRSGVALLALRRWDEAEAAFVRAIELDGHRPAAYDGLGTALHQQRRHAEAATQFQRSLGLRYDSAHVHLRLAQALGAAGERAEAVAALQRALALDPALGSTRAARDVMNTSLTRD